MGKINQSSTDYYIGGSKLISPVYDGIYDWPPPPPVKTKTEEFKSEAQGKKGTLSIFNRYSIFFFNNDVQNATKPIDYLDKAANYQNKDKRIIQNPSASNIIQWSSSGKTNAVEYTWQDFLWCKNYGIVPNNYMITLRRFKIPVSDDLRDPGKNPVPDVGRMIAWIDGESNTWESAGMKWSHNLVWKEIESKIHEVAIQSGTQYGNEGQALQGVAPLAASAIQNISYLAQDGNKEQSLKGPQPQGGGNPYTDPNKVYGPINVIMKTNIRGQGLQFDQAFALKFEYEMRSIDGINPKIAMIDLLSNIMFCTYNKGAWWGGEIRYTGGASSRKITPLGDPKLLANGDYSGFVKSIQKGISERVGSLTGGAGLTLEGLGNAAKNLGGNLAAKIAGGFLDEMGRPDPAAVQGTVSLMSGQDTGEWHLTIGNPMNPIAMIGNLILEKTDVKLHGPLGVDDFPTKIDVVCTLKPARPRDMLDVMGMFHRSARTYLTISPGAGAINIKQNKLQNGKPTIQTGKNPGKPRPQAVEKFYDQKAIEFVNNTVVKNRFPNHAKKLAPVQEVAKLLD
jgi:hypothetical protein